DVRRAVEVAIPLAADRGGAARRGDEPQQHPERRGLARAVRPEEAGHPARLDPEVEAGDGFDRPEPLGHPVEDECLSLRHASTILSPEGVAPPPHVGGASRATARTLASSTAEAGSQMARSIRLRVIALSTPETALSPTTTQTTTGSAASGSGAQTGMPASRATQSASSAHTTAATALETRKCVGRTPGCCPP